MRYPGDLHVLLLFGPWRWAPYMRGKFYWKKYQNARSFFLSHTSKLHQQKQRVVVSKSTAKTDPSNKYNIFPCFIIDQSWNTLQLKNIVQSFHPPFDPITALFTFTGLWPKDITNFRQRTKKIVKIQTNKHFKAHLYCLLHHLPQSYSREPLQQPYPLHILQVNSLYSKIMKRKSEHIHFLMSLLLYIRNALNFTHISL